MSTTAGTPEPGNGRPAAEQAPLRGLRDRPLGRLLLLAAVLIAAVIATKTCAARGDDVSQDEAIELAKEHASFTPCAESGCIIVRALGQGIPSRLVWIVGLAEDLGPGGEPTRFENFEIDASTGEVVRR